MHPHMWWSILKSMNKSIFFSFELNFVCLWLCLQQTSLLVFTNPLFFRALKEEENRYLPDQVIQQPHIYFILSNNSYCSMMKDIFHCISTALEDLDISFELVFKLGQKQYILLQGIHANPETWFQYTYLQYKLVLPFLHLFLYIEFVFISLKSHLIIYCVLKQEL